jgi:hypothetical protein
MMYSDCIHEVSLRRRAHMHWMRAERQKWVNLPRQKTKCGGMFSSSDM